jgi:hypothetical protein
MSEHRTTTTEVRRSRRRTAPRRILVLAFAAAALTPAAAMARPADDTGAPATGSQQVTADTTTAGLVAQERSYASANRPDATATPTPTATARPSTLLAQARYYSSYGPATTTTRVSAAPTGPAPADDGTSWSTIVLVGLGACLAGAGAVAAADRRLGVRHSRIPA